MRSEDFRRRVSRSLFARALLLLSIVVFAPREAAIAQSARREDAGTHNFLVLGVRTAKADALDPSNPDNVLRFRNDFRDILALSYSDLADRSQSGGAIQLGADLGEAFMNLGGLRVDRVIGELLPLRDQRIDVLVVHSWAGAAVLEALDRGFLRQPPRQLVVVAPPQLTPAGGERWRRLAERYPQMAIDIYVSRGDILQRVRESMQVFHDALAHPRLDGPPSDEEIAGEVLAYFTARNVRVRTYPAPATALDAHAVHHFLEFAAARGLYGLRGETPIPPKETALDNRGDDAFEVEVSRTTARVADIEEVAQREAMALREVQAHDEARMREMELLMWRYFASLVESACAGAPPRNSWSDGVVFSSSVLSELGRAHRGDLSECGRRLLDGVLAAERPVMFAWVREEARRYRAKVADEERRRAEAASREAERRRAEEARERANAAVSTSGGRRTEDGGERERSIRTPDIENTSGMRDARGVLSNMGRWDGR